MTSVTPCPAAPTAGWLVLLLRGLLGAGSVAALTFLYLNLDRGFDLTDEAYYLLWIDRPAAYDIAGSMFGIALSPIYHLTGSDPAWLRRIGLVVAALTAAAMCWTVLRLNARGRPPAPGAVAMAAAAAASVATYYHLWLPTPSYNWLPLPAGFLLLTGVSLLQHDRMPIGSTVMIGLAGLLAFAGKPTTGAAFALVYLLGAVAAAGFSRRTMRHVALSGVACLALLALASVSFLDPWIAFRQARGYVDFFGAAPPIGSYLASLHIPPGYHVAAIAAVLAYHAPGLIARFLGIVAIVAALVVEREMHNRGYDYAQGVVVMAACLALVANCLAWSPQRPRWRQLLVPALAFVMPWVAAFGTSNALVWQTSFYAAFPLAGSIAIAYLCFGDRDWRAIGAAMLAPFFAGLALNAAQTAPYRLSSTLGAQVLPVTVGGGVLRVDARTRAFIDTLREQVAEAGFEEGTPVLDFSGSTPGIAFLLNGHPPGFPWLVGGYEFSPRLAEQIVTAMPVEKRRSAWLVQGETPIAFKPDFIRSLGFDLESGYELAASVAHPIDGTAVRIYAPLSRADIQ